MSDECWMYYDDSESHLHTSPTMKDPIGYHIFTTHSIVIQMIRIRKKKRIYYTHTQIKCYHFNSGKWIIFEWKEWCDLFSMEITKITKISFEWPITRIDHNFLIVFVCMRKDWEYIYSCSFWSTYLVMVHEMSFQIIDTVVYMRLCKCYILIQWECISAGYMLQLYAVALNIN